MTDSTYILVVDDNHENLKVVGNFLKEKNYKIAMATDGKSALKILENNSIDLILLDIMMPEMDGFEVCRQLKENPSTRDIPVIFLTARTETEDIVKGFQLGGVDYITKPFSMEELLYRIKAILKRTSGTTIPKKETSYTIGNYTFDALKQTLNHEKENIKLTTKESELLELLCRHRNEILERNYALKSIWIDDNYFNARSMDVYITRLRKYLRKDPAVKILNVHGRGYKLLC